MSINDIIQAVTLAVVTILVAYWKMTHGKVEEIHTLISASQSQSLTMLSEEKPTVNPNDPLVGVPPKTE